MVDLIAKSPCDGVLPLTEGGVSLTEVVVDRLMSVAPFAGQEEAVSAALKHQIGTGLSAVGRRAGPVTWCGHGQWLVAGVVDLTGLAAVTDQSDALAVVEIAGEGVEDVLARLVPVYLRAGQFGEGHVARTMLGHLTVTITRVGRESFEIMALRSMARTLVHVLEVAMTGLAAR